MTIDEVCDHIGEGVVYTPAGGAPDEYGVITGASDRVAFVRYDGDQHAKGTYPSDLGLLGALL